MKVMDSLFDTILSTVICFVHDDGENFLPIECHVFNHNIRVELIGQICILLRNLWNLQERVILETIISALHVRDTRDAKIVSHIVFTLIKNAQASRLLHKSISRVFMIFHFEKASSILELPNDHSIKIYRSTNC